MAVCLCDMNDMHKMKLRPEKTMVGTVSNDSFDRERYPFPATRFGFAMHSFLKAASTCLL